MIVTVTPTMFGAAFAAMPTEILTDAGPDNLPLPKS
jgi:hypothetical protein